MKKILLFVGILISLLVYTNGIQAQTVTANLDQLKLAQIMVGTWQSDVGKDTVDIWEVQQYGKAFVSTGFRIISGKKSFSFAENWCFSSKENKFKGFVVWPGGGYQTFIFSFTSENKTNGDWILNFNPEAVTGKFEAVYETPTSLIITQFAKDGVRKSAIKMNKVK